MNKDYVAKIFWRHNFVYVLKKYYILKNEEKMRKIKNIVLNEKKYEKRILKIEYIGLYQLRKFIKNLLNFVYRKRK